MVLFQKKTTIAVEVGAHEVMPGQQLNARVSIDPGGDDKLQAVRVELRYRNRFYYRRSRSSADGGGWEDSLTVDTVTVASATIPDPLAVPDTFDVALTLPPDAPATLPDWVDWRLETILDRRRGRDQTDEVPITVLAPPEPPGTWVWAEPVTEGKCDIWVELESWAAHVGDTLSGVLQVSSRDAFDAKVRLELLHVMRHEDNITSTLSKEKVTLADRMRFEPEIPQRFPFQIRVPASGMPSMCAKHNEARWYVKGICERRMRGDHSTTEEIFVHNARRAPIV